MKYLAIIAKMPDNYAAAWDHGGGYSYWAEELLGSSFECDFCPDENGVNAWADYVTKHFGVTKRGAREAFDVVSARILDEESGFALSRFVDGAPPAFGAESGAAAEKVEGVAK